MSSIGFDLTDFKNPFKDPEPYDRKQSGPGPPGKSRDRLDDVISIMSFCFPNRQWFW